MVEEDGVPAEREGLGQADDPVVPSSYRSPRLCREVHASVKAPDLSLIDAEYPVWGKDSPTDRDQEWTGPQRFRRKDPEGVPDTPLFPLCHFRGEEGLLARIKGEAAHRERNFCDRHRAASRDALPSGRDRFDEER
jgi:hypothetical protein